MTIYVVLVLHNVTQKLHLWFRLERSFSPTALVPYLKMVLCKMTLLGGITCICNVALENSPCGGRRLVIGHTQAIVSLRLPGSFAKAWHAFQRAFRQHVEVARNWPRVLRGHLEGICCMATAWIKSSLPSSNLLLQ
jgi:hypothetical protein